MASETRVWPGMLCILVVATWLSVTWDTHNAAERPVESAILMLFLSGAGLFLASKIGNLTNSPPPRGRWPDSLELSENSGRDRSPRARRTSLQSGGQHLHRHTRQKIFISTVAAIVLRVGTLWQISRDIQCSRKAVEAILLPWVLLVYEAFTVVRPIAIVDEVDVMSNSLYTDISQAISRSLARHVVPTLLLCFGVHQTYTQSLPSSYICSITISAASAVLFSQITGTFLDAFIVIQVWKVMENEPNEKRRMVASATTLVSSASILAIMSIVITLWTWGTLTFVTSLSIAYVWSIIKDTVACVILMICALHLNAKIRPLSLVVSAVFCCVYADLALTAWSSRSTFPPQSNSTRVVGLLFLFSGFVLSTFNYGGAKPDKPPRTSQKHIPTLFTLLVTISVIVTAVFFSLRNNEVGTHPIYSLLYEARIDGDRWVKAASPSATLDRAVTEYRLRHFGREPPPSFDKWYAFALERGSPIIDEFDSIDRDLLPFWAMTPAEIRQNTPAVTNPTEGRNDIVLVTIRDGKGIATPDDALNNKDMKGILTMIDEFAEWLPDMEIAFNVRREPRVSLPWKQIDPLRKKGAHVMSQTTAVSKNSGFTDGGKEKWPSHEDKVKHMKNVKSRRWRLFLPSIFDEKVTPSCPPFSQARRNRGWNPQDFCASCAEPHSKDQFLRNWTIAADLCHQPDIANLHGFFTGDKIDTEMLPNGVLSPLFSRSKTSGFNDILFPYPGDYVDTETPDLRGMDFNEKNDKLFWRGLPTAEGISFDNQWKGMQQQRLVHLANNLDPKKPVPMLLPALAEDRYVYENIPASALKTMSEKIDIGFIKIDACGKDPTCSPQLREFGTRPSVTLSEHGNYRYLVSLDRNGGPNPEFIPYLLSNSVPFHTSIFRSWYDDRLMPWLHFVPIDSRFQAVQSTLAYFTGFTGRVGPTGREITMEGKATEGRWIADQGQKWAEKALRKDDATVYAFRLLLEWGRLVDDKRDEIGFVGGQ